MTAVQVKFNSAVFRINCALFIPTVIHVSQLLVMIFYLGNLYLNTWES